ncbi:MAG: Fe-S protein assembly co-chaperone HscB [Alphaproteobacteria bacterium]|nr:Fe-S protein assembly co-chaperone HscB [Alphaproteobacteria bacterium]
MFDPFKILNLEKCYALDQQTLEKQYFEEQKKCHPDQFSSATDQEKTDAVKKSTAVNQAYLMLKNPCLRAEYLLKDMGLETLSHEPSFLGTVMEWNERLERGEDLKPELLDQEKILCGELEKSFDAKNYEKVRVALYQLIYVQKLLKQSEGL